MVRLDLWLSYVTLELVLTATPGPAVLTVIAQGLRHGGGRAFLGALGISAANAIYFAVSGLGLGATLAARPALFAVLVWGAVGYLGYTGLGLVLHRAGPEAARSVPPPAPGALFRQGLTTQLGNPKAMIFFAALLTPFLDPTRPIPAQLVVYALTTFALEIPILAAYGALAGRAARFAGGRSGARLDRLAGAMLVGAAILVAVRAL